MGTPPVTSIQLLGCDGSTWDLLSGESPVTLDGGLGGLHLPNVTHQWSDVPGRPGRIWRGSQTLERAFTIRVLVGDRIPPYRTGPDWTDLDAQFWEAFSTEETSSLVVNGQRKLDFRLDETQDYEFALDPSINGKAVYPIAVVAADPPLWHGDPITFPFPWTPSPEVNYYGGDSGGGFGPPFYITEAALFTTAMISNPGDYPAWPTWILTGPVPTVSVGVGEDVITLPFSLNTGDIVIINTETGEITDPQGVNLWPQMGYAPVDMAPIPRGDLVPIRIGLEGASAGASVAVTITPQFRRAWGVRPNVPIIPGGGEGGSVGGLGDMPLGDGPLGD